ncbi:MAG: septal ring lytic transglycosylase RlpA family protein [Candidatus Acidiferrales bacterium]
MPFINGKFYMNPAYGRALEHARASEEASRHNESSQQEPDSHWVTINGRHVLIRGTQATGTQQHTKQFSGDATYYNLPGKKTASGAKFDPNKMTAAMTAEKVKLGQTVAVTYTTKDKQGNTVTRSITVVVNDRGPFARDAEGKATVPLQPADGKVIDLTPAAFEKLVGTTKPGHVAVTVTVPNE